MAKPVTISAILEDLKNGMTRKDINAKYELNPIDIKKLWSHEKLKNKKTAKYVSELELIDDTIEVDYGKNPLPTTVNPTVTKVGEGIAPAMKGSF